MSSRMTGPNIPFYDLSFDEKGRMYHRGPCRGRIVQPMRVRDWDQPASRAFCRGCSRLMGKKAWRLLEIPLRGGDIVGSVFQPGHGGATKQWFRMFLRGSPAEPCDPEPPIAVEEVEVPEQPLMAMEDTLEKVLPTGAFAKVMKELDGRPSQPDRIYPRRRRAPVSVQAHTRNLNAGLEPTVRIVKGNISMSIPRGNLTMGDLGDLLKALERMPDKSASVRRIGKLVGLVRSGRAKKEKHVAYAATYPTKSERTGKTSANKEKMYSGGLKPLVKRKVITIGSKPRRRW